MNLLSLQSFEQLVPDQHNENTHTVVYGKKPCLCIYNKHSVNNNIATSNSILT